MNNQSSRLLTCTLLLLTILTGYTACHTSKTKTSTASVVKEAPVAFSIDTIGNRYQIAPKKGHTIIIENLQVHITSNTQPGVGVSITRADSSRSNIILPHVTNANVYAFGGTINLTLKSGDVAIVDAADIVNSKPIQARFIISGTEQKN